MVVYKEKCNLSVAPLAGARIEIYIKEELGGIWEVAPLAGARIEIIRKILRFIERVSLPSRERGLKYDKAANADHRQSRSPRGSAD